MKIGRKLFYEKLTGSIIIDTGERQGFVAPTTIEQDIEIYKALSERTRDSFDYIELEYGQYAQDFAECNGYRVNVELLDTLPEDEKHKAIEFSYPDPNEEEPQEPVYQEPLSQKVEQLEQEKQLLQLQVDALTQQGELLEGAIVELASLVLE